MSGVFFLSERGRSKTDGASHDVISEDKGDSCAPLNLLENFARCLKGGDQESETDSSLIAADNVVRPRIRQWSGDFILQATTRLAENPTREQLEKFHKAMAEITPNQVWLDLFVVLFGAALDRMSVLFQATIEQRIQISAEIMNHCGMAALICLESFGKPHFSA